MKLGIVGCGGIAREVARAANANPQVQPLAVCDVTLAGAEKFAADFNIPSAYGDYSAMLAQADLDAIYLATPHYLHHPMMLAAIRAGRHIWCEKPITITVQEAWDVINHAAAAGVKVGVNYQTRYDPECVRMYEAVRSGALGEIYYARTNTPYLRDASYYAGWHAVKAQAGGGTMLTVGSHMIDAVLWVTGRRPIAAEGRIARKKFTQIEVEDLAMGIVELEDGILVEVCSSMIANPQRTPGIELYGSRDTFFFSLNRVDASAPDRYENNITRSLEGFRAWVEEGVPYRTPAPEAVPALAVVEAIYRSAESGRREEVCIRG